MPVLSVRYRAAHQAARPYAFGSIGTTVLTTTVSQNTPHRLPVTSTYYNRSLFISGRRVVQKSKQLKYTLFPTLPD